MMSILNNHHRATTLLKLRGSAGCVRAQLRSAQVIYNNTTQSMRVVKSREKQSPAASSPPAKASQRNSLCHARVGVPEKYCNSPTRPWWCAPEDSLVWIQGNAQPTLVWQGVNKNYSSDPSVAVVRQKVLLFLPVKPNMQKSAEKL